MGFRSLLMSAGLLWFGVNSAYAQALPDAGSLRQNNEQFRSNVLPDVSPIRVNRGAGNADKNDTLFIVNEYRFLGNTLFSDEELTRAIARFTGQSIGFAQLREMTDTITDVYSQSGWLVRTYLPRQDITEGVVAVRIEEAAFGKVSLRGESSERLGEERLRRRFTVHQSVGKPFSTMEFDRALLIANDLPGISVAGRLKAGESAGATDLILETEDGALYTAEVRADNLGQRSTGSERLSVDGYINSPLRFGDRASAHFVHSRGSDHLQLGYSLPVGYQGWRMGINTTVLDYRVITPEFDALALTGSSTSIDGEASYPLVRQPGKNMLLSSGIHFVDTQNDSRAGVQSDYRLTFSDVRLLSNSRDQWRGGGANGAALSFAFGSVSHGDLDPGENPAVSGSFTKLRYRLSREQRINDTVSLYGELSGQESQTELVSSQRFYLGGSFGVRAYPSSEGSGDSGQLARLELRRRLDNAVTLAGFVDWGKVRLVGPGRDNELKGIGASLGWKHRRGISVKGIWATRMGDNLNASPNGDDRDGTFVRNRFWLSAQINF